MEEAGHAVVQAVEGLHFVPSVQQMFTKDAAQIAGRARDKDFHGGGSYRHFLMPPDFVYSPTMRVVAALGVFLALSGARSRAQDSTPAPGPCRDTGDEHSGAPLGQFTAGPFIITPTFRIGSLAVDTNVQYQRDRRTDFVASAGPGLDIALPFRITGSWICGGHRSTSTSTAATS